MALASPPWGRLGRPWWPVPSQQCAPPTLSVLAAPPSHQVLGLSPKMPFARAAVAMESVLPWPPWKVVLLWETAKMEGGGSIISCNQIK